MVLGGGSTPGKLAEVNENPLWRNGFSFQDPFGISQIGAHGKITKHTKKQVAMNNRYQKQEIAEFKSLRS